MINEKGKLIDGRPKAVALLSGGLDSTLAVLALLKQDIDVTAITFLTHFGCDITDSSSCSHNPMPAAEKYGFKLKLSHLGEKFFNIIKDPKFGHGKNMNPCMDCRILMLREARTFMALTGADFLVTGEVVGQRPMSQRRQCFPLVDREAGVEGLVLRPLSAKNLQPTVPELNGLVNRDMLYGFSGRTRKPQIALADEFGLTDYPAPAGGCLLTEPVYSERLRDLLRHTPDPELEDLHLLRVGRNFRLSPECRTVIGRNEEENNKITSLASADDILLEVAGVGSPITILRGAPGEKEIMIAAAMTARYSDAKKRPLVEVTVFNQRDLLYRLTSAPASNDIIESYRIAGEKAAAPEETVVRM